MRRKYNRTLYQELARTSPWRSEFGKSSHPLYDVWSSMIRRCYDKNCRGYPDYGGRGIGITSKWIFFETFVNDMGPRPFGHSIHRIDNDADYSAENCRWATDKEQARNRRGTKLTQEDVDGIRMLSALGMGSRKLGKMYDVAHPTISRVVHGKSWCKDG